MSNLETTETTTTEARPTAVTRTFSELLNSDTLRGAIEKLGFTNPTPVQAKTIPPALAGYDLIVQAKTGSGKTLAYSLPILELIEKLPTQDQTFALVVVPTRELATQISEVIATVSGIRVPTLIGGMSGREQGRALSDDKRIVVGTPGRILDFLDSREFSLDHCKSFVLDEADEMLSTDFLEDIERILKRMPQHRQGIFVSATITPNVEMLARRFLKEPKHIIVETPAEAMPQIEHRFYEVGGDLVAKATALCDLLETVKPRSAIIFCNTKSDTELVEVFLRRRGFDARRINSDLNQKQRNAVMGRIKSGELRFLVGTDIAARGIDIEQLDAVINYTIPEQPEVYVHRTGRTGRAGRSGIALSLVGPGDFTAFQNLKRENLVAINKSPLPSEEEVIAARLEHFSELLSNAKINLQPRDEVLAEKLIASSPDLKVLLTKLYRFSLEHMFSTQVRALEEELDGDQQDGGRSGGQRQHSHRGGGHRGGRNGGGRHQRGRR